MAQSDEILEMDLIVGDADWAPTPHGVLLAKVLAEHDLVRGKRVLEIGAGSGNHTIILLRRGAAQVVATEVDADRLATTQANVERNCPDAAVEYRVADWLQTGGRFEVVVSNPPFCQSGKRNRRYFIDSLILDVHKRLESGGRLIFVQSSMADLAKTQRRLAENGFESAVLGESQGPFRDYYFEDPSFLEEATRVPGGFEVRDGVCWETLYVLAATLLE